MSSELARPIPDKLSIWPAEVGAAVVAFIGDGL